MQKVTILYMYHVGFGRILKKYELFSNEFVSNYAVLCKIRVMRTWSNARMGSAYRNVARVGRMAFDTHGYFITCIYVPPLSLLPYGVCV